MHCCGAPVLLLSAYILGVLTAGYYFGVFAMAWDLLFGFAGEVNFGPTFRIGLGAYTAATVNSKYALAIPWCVLAGVVSALIGGLLLAVPALRLRGPYFGLVTLVAVLLLQNAIVIFAGVTGGEIGMTVPDVLSLSAATNYWYGLVFLVVCAVILFGLSRSAIGLIPAGQRAGSDRSASARIQRRQAQANGVLDQRCVFRHGRRHAGVLFGGCFCRHPD